MPLSGTAIVKIYPMSLNSTKGCYVNEPDSGPFIVLSSDLDEFTSKMVCDRLMEHHNNIPENSIYKLFPMVVCFEDLPEQAQTAVELSPVVEGRALQPARSWQFGPGKGAMHVIPRR